VSQVSCVKAVLLGLAFWANSLILCYVPLNAGFDLALAHILFIYLGKRFGEALSLDG